MGEMKKVTVMLPADLLERATMGTGKGIEATIREGLETLVSSHAYEGLRGLRGKMKLSVDLDELRRD